MKKTLLNLVAIASALFVFGGSFVEAEEELCFKTAAEASEHIRMEYGVDPSYLVRSDAEDRWCVDFSEVPENERPQRLPEEIIKAKRATVEELVQRGTHRLQAVGKFTYSNTWEKLRRDREGWGLLPYLPKPDVPTTNETTQETTKETTAETSQETTKETTKETTTDTTQETTKETTKETTAETSQETTGETTAETSQETTGETTAETSKETTVESTKDKSTTAENRETTNGKSTSQKSNLPQTGELTSWSLVSGAVLSALAGLGLVAGKKEEC